MMIDQRLKISSIDERKAGLYADCNKIYPRHRL